MTTVDQRDQELTSFGQQITMRMLSGKLQSYAACNISPVHERGNAPYRGSGCRVLSTMCEIRWIRMVWKCLRPLTCLIVSTTAEPWDMLLMTPIAARGSHGAQAA